MAQKLVGPPTPARPSRPVHADGGTRKLCLRASGVEPSCSAMPASPASVSSTLALDNIILSPPPRVGRQDFGDRRPGPSPESGGHRRRLPMNSNTRRIALSVAIHFLRHPTTCAQTLEGDHPRRVHRPCDRWCWRDWSTQNRHLSRARAATKSLSRAAMMASLGREQLSSRRGHSGTWGRRDTFLNVHDRTTHTTSQTDDSPSTPQRKLATPQNYP